MLGLRVPAERGEDAKKTMLSLQLLDKGHKIANWHETVVFPLLAHPDETVIKRLNGELLEFEPEPREHTKERPFHRIQRELAHLPHEIAEKIPPRWEMHGRLLTLRLPEDMRPHFRDIAEAYARILGCEAVILDKGGVAGEYREPVAELIFGEKTETTHRENGIRYSFDAARIMFSSGNVDERVRMAGLDCGGEVVVDMFAGIGYFSLPIAKYTGAVRVISIEKNPVAYEYLLRNIEDNGLENIEAYNMDNRDFEPTGIADRVIMGYVGTTHLFLDKALSILKDTGIIHYHETCPEALLPDRPLERLKAAAEKNGRMVDVRGTKRVKSYSPGVYHIVVDAEFERI